MNTVSGGPYLKRGIIGYWPLDGNSNDIIGGNNGSDINVTYTDGLLDRASTFVGDGYISINDASRLNFMHQTLTFSISFILKKDDTITTDVFLGSTYSGITTPGILGALYSNGSFSMQVNTVVGSNVEGIYISSDLGVISDINSHFFVFTGNYSKREAKLYLDGNLINSDSSASLWHLGSGDCSPLTLGAWLYYYLSFPNTYNLNGQISHFALWDRALSANEVNGLYNNGIGLKIRA